MAWTTPAYTRGEVNRAGRAYIDPDISPEERELARTVINNWRSSHSYPLNTLQVNLRGVAGRFDSSSTVAQRIKRLPSIRHKLERYPSMELARMHDIGGARAVMGSVTSVKKVIDYYEAHSSMKHKLLRKDTYIDDPKDSGYRGVHLVYSYYSDKQETYNGLRIELQIRSRLQHAWATAVETVGTFTQQALKSSLGEEGWLRFFVLMSSAMALRERSPLVPGTPDDPAELIEELRHHAAELNVVERLTAYGEALRHVEQTMEAAKGTTFLLELDIAAQHLYVRSYSDKVVAVAEYSALEQALEGDPSKDVVLVSVESLASLRRAYPNYCLDTSAFVESLQKAID
jgi:Region found in RelA / SpoT proteins